MPPLPCMRSSAPKGVGEGCEAAQLSPLGSRARGEGEKIKNSKSKEKANLYKY